MKIPKVSLCFYNWLVENFMETHVLQYDVEMFKADTSCDSEEKLPFLRLLVRFGFFFVLSYLLIISRTLSLASCRGLNKPAQPD